MSQYTLSEHKINQYIHFFNIYFNSVDGVLRHFFLKIIENLFFLNFDKLKLNYSQFLQTFSIAVAAFTDINEQTRS